MTKSVTYLKVNYLDASAAVRFVLNEPGSAALINYFLDDDSGSFYITSLCLAEALGVLKGKWQRKKISIEEYTFKCESLLTYLHRKPKSIHLDDIQLTDLDVFADTEKIAKRHNLDLSDALQLVSVANRFGKFTGPSAPLLITADGLLASAAQNEGVRVWNCLMQASPPPLTKPTLAVLRADQAPP